MTRALLSDTILNVSDLHTWFSTDAGIISVLNGIDFSLQQGKCLVLLGESGSGKSVTALSIMRLLPDSADTVFGKVISGDKIG